MPKSSHCKVWVDGTLGVQTNTSSPLGSLTDVACGRAAPPTAKPRPGLVYQHMDASNMAFAEGTFDAVVDKSTLDALVRCD